MILRFPALLLLHDDCLITKGLQTAADHHTFQHELSHYSVILLWIKTTGRASSTFNLIALDSMEKEYLLMKDNAYDTCDKISRMWLVLMMPSPPGMTLSCGLDMCTVDLFLRRKRVLMALRVSGLSNFKQGWGAKKKVREAGPTAETRVLPVLAWCFHRGEFRSLWQRPGHYHLCPAPWWQQCLFQFRLDPLKKERRESLCVSVVFSKLSFKHFNSALTLHWCTWPNYGILIFPMFFN